MVHQNYFIIEFDNKWTYNNKVSCISACFMLFVVLFNEIIVLTLLLLFEMVPVIKYLKLILLFCYDRPWRCPIIRRIYIQKEEKGCSFLWKSSRGSDGRNEQNIVGSCTFHKNRVLFQLGMHSNYNRKMSELIAICIFLYVRRTSSRPDFFRNKTALKITNLKIYF